MRTVWLALLAGVTLVACSPKAANEAKPEAAAPAAPKEVSIADMQIGPIHALGNEPFWAADLANGTLTVARPGEPAKTVAVKQPGALMTFTGDGVSLALTPGECSDGMSDRRYPMSAELTLDGKTMKGCAHPKDQPPAGGEALSRHSGQRSVSGPLRLSMWVARLITVSSRSVRSFSP